MIIHNEYVDFEAPIQMTVEQREKFIKFMEILCPEIRTENIMKKPRYTGENEKRN